MRGKSKQVVINNWCCTTLYLLRYVFAVKRHGQFIGVVRCRNTYILLTKREGRTGRISARGLGPRSWSVRKRPRADILPVGSRASLVNKRFITRLKNAKTCKDTSAGSFGTMPGPILREYWTGNRAFWLADFSYWPSDCQSRVIILIIIIIIIIINYYYY